MPVDERHAFATIRELSGEIRSGRISPVELTDMFLDRIGRYDDQLVSFITVTPDIARREARQAEEEIRAGRYRGPLHGIPYGLKDIIATRGVRTTWGAHIFGNQVPDHDATVTMRLRETGAVLVGKLATGEFAGGSRHLGGQVRNPWNLNYSPSGSSCGPGAATAAGLVTFSIGSETSGSIMGPSGSNGLTGLVPSYGRISRYGVMALSWSLDKLGPMCHSADDVAIVLEAVAGKDPNDPTSRDAPFPYTGMPADVRGMKLGIVRDEFWSTDEEGTREVFDQALAKLRELGAETEDVTLREFPYSEVLRLTINVESAAAFEDVVREGRFDEFVVKTRGNSWAAGLTVSAVDYLRAQRIRTEIIQYARSLFDRFDALVGPTSPSTARMIEEGGGGGRREPDPNAPPRYLSNLSNLSGVPFVSTRCGFKDGLPLGLRFVGPPFGEARILQIAHTYEQATDWSGEVPQFTE